MVHYITRTCDTYLDCAKNPGHAIAITLWQSGRKWRVAYGGVYAEQVSPVLSRLSAQPGENHGIPPSVPVFLPSAGEGTKPCAWSMSWVSWDRCEWIITFDALGLLSMRMGTRRWKEPCRAFLAESQITLPSRESGVKKGIVGDARNAKTYFSDTGHYGYRLQLPWDQDHSCCGERLIAERARSSVRAIRQALRGTGLPFLKLSWCGILESTRPWIKSWLCHVLAMWPWEIT